MTIEQSGTIEKVKLPREVAEAIEELRLPSNGFSNYSIIGMLFQSHLYKHELTSIEILDRYLGQGEGQIHPDHLIKALINGYEVEETPEEKVREYYEKQIRGEMDGTFDSSHYAIKHVLDLLNIKIEGVNTYD